MTDPRATAGLDTLDDQALLDLVLDLLADRLAPRVAERLADLPAAATGHDGREGYLAPAAAAEYLGVKTKRIYDLKGAGALIPDACDGRKPLYLRSTLDAYAKGRA